VNRVYFNINSPEAQALLSSPNGQGTVWFLAQHKNPLGWKIITGVTVFMNREDTSWNFLFRIANHTATNHQQATGSGSKRGPKYEDAIKEMYRLAASDVHSSLAVRDEPDVFGDAIKLGAEVLTNVSSGSLLYDTHHPQYMTDEYDFDFATNVTWSVSESRSKLIAQEVLSRVASNGADSKLSLFKAEGMALIGTYEGSTVASLIASAVRDRFISDVSVVGGSDSMALCFHIQDFKASGPDW